MKKLLRLAALFVTSFTGNAQTITPTIVAGSGVGDFFTFIWVQTYFKPIRIGCSNKGHSALYAMLQVLKPLINYQLCLSKLIAYQLYIF